MFAPPPAAKDCRKLEQFCPIEHRGAIIEIFRRHWHYHSTIPTSNGVFLSATEIHRCSMHEMYDYCYEHELAQPWGYLWNCWYQKDQYILWARSAHESIPRLKTTMIAEGTFKQIKHVDLAYHNRPRIDHVVYIILHSFLPRLLDKLGLLEKKRVGRPKGLAGWQKDLHCDWIFMSKSDAEQRVRRELAVRRSGLKGKARTERLAQLAEDEKRQPGTHHTSLEAWTCSCRAYLLSRFLTCKHLVRQAEMKIGSKENDLKFFRELRCNHRPPYYNISGIHAPPSTPPLVDPTPPPDSGPPTPPPTAQVAEDRQDLREEVLVERVSLFQLPLRIVPISSAAGFPPAK